MSVCVQKWVQFHQGVELILMGTKLLDNGIPKR